VPAPRHLPARRDIPWSELRRRSTVVFLWLQAGWSALSAEEQEDVRRLLVKSKGRPGNLSRDEAKRLGGLAGKAAAAATGHRR
jgi:hypothetical protein